MLCSNAIQQKLALDELAILLNDAMPHKLNLPRVPFPDARPNARPNVVDPNLNHPSELLIDFSEDASDLPTPTQQPSQGTPPVFTETFVIDSHVHDPYKMFYPTKRQKNDLPEIIASSRNCTAVISNDSREITIQGESMIDVGRCISDLHNMQSYFLRSQHRLEKVSLVYGSTRDPFRIILVPLPRHRYCSTHIEYFPSDMPHFVDPSKHLVAVKASYDSVAGDWLPDAGALTPLNLPPNGRSNSRQGRSPQSASGQGSPDDRSWGPAPTGGVTEWYDQDSDAFGFGFGFAHDLPSVERRPSATQPSSSTSGMASRGHWPTPSPRTPQPSQTPPSPLPSNLALSTGSWPTPGGAKSPQATSSSSSRWGQGSSSRPDSRSSGPSSFASKAQTLQGGGIVRTMERTHVTTSSSAIESMFGFLGQPAVESAEFHVICDTRTNPQSKYVRTLITVPPTVAILDRVVTPWDTYAEVSWNSMDKNTDFEILLQAREGVIHDVRSALGRTDVKPFSAFRKSLSIGTHNKHISCREIPNYLEIRSINYKETRKYTFDENEDFTVLVHNVQELELTRIKETDTVTGRTYGTGKAWYEIEVYSDNLNRHFSSNLTLTEGLTADWEAKDILGSNPANSDELSKMIKNTMLVVDQCQARFKD
ncbi:hypothetical protein BGZ52_002619 [Haplosporangium bisporale]|nr:hypothetical protein BGZ52_002619 [Haplosporangium bisporale]